MVKPFSPVESELPTLVLQGSNKEGRHAEA
jgi:hypothetical protein